MATMRGGSIPAPSAWGTIGSQLGKGINKYYEKKEKEDKEKEDYNKKVSLQTALYDIQQGNKTVVPANTPGAQQIPGTDVWLLNVGQDASGVTQKEMTAARAEFSKQWGRTLAPDEVLDMTQEELERDQEAYVANKMFGSFGMQGISNAEVRLLPKETQVGIFNQLDPAAGFEYDANSGAITTSEERQKIAETQAKTVEDKVKKSPSNKGTVAALAGIAASPWTIPFLKGAAAGALPAGAMQTMMAPSAGLLKTGLGIGGAAKAGMGAGMGMAGVVPTAAGIAGAGAGGHLLGRAIGKMPWTATGPSGQQYKGNIDDALQRKFRQFMLRKQTANNPALAAELESQPTIPTSLWKY